MQHNEIAWPTPPPTLQEAWGRDLLRAPGPAALAAVQCSERRGDRACGRHDSSSRPPAGSLRVPQWSRGEPCWILRLVLLLQTQSLWTPEVAAPSLVRMLLAPWRSGTAHPLARRANRLAVIEKREWRPIPASSPGSRIPSATHSCLTTTLCIALQPSAFCFHCYFHSHPPTAWLVPSTFALCLVLCLPNNLALSPIFSQPLLPPRFALYSVPISLPSHHSAIVPVRSSAGAPPSVNPFGRAEGAPLPTNPFFPLITR